MEKVWGIAVLAKVVLISSLKPISSNASSVGLN